MKHKNMPARPAPHIPAGSPARQEPLLHSGCSLGRDCGRRADARSIRHRLTALLLAAALLVPALLLTACSSGASDGAAGGALGGGTGADMSASAATMFLRKTEGTVAVSDAEGADIAPAENLGLYSGYTVGTEEESYAWIDLDKVKLTKLNENSAVEITKDGKNLSIDVTSGSLFFNVTEPLTDDETMEISTSSMLMGIRGTCGWVAQNAVGLLEGTVTVTAEDETVTINAGERVVLTQDGTLEVSELSPFSIPAFVARELLDDDALQQTVLEASGLHMPTSYEEWVNVLEQEHPEREIVHSEPIDFQQDGDPELLVVCVWEIIDSNGNPRQGISAIIYQYRPEGIRWLAQGDFSNNHVKQAGCSLVEADGRQFVLYWLDDGWDKGYVGSLAGQDGGPDNWGVVDRFSGNYAQRHDERGFAVSSELEDFESTPKYTLVRELCSQTFDS